jgi:hypothetical protein
MTDADPTAIDAILERLAEDETIVGTDTARIIPMPRPPLSSPAKQRTRRRAGRHAHLRRYRAKTP